MANNANKTGHPMWMRVLFNLPLIVVVGVILVSIMWGENSYIKRLGYQSRIHQSTCENHLPFLFLKSHDELVERHIETISLQHAEDIGIELPVDIPVVRRKNIRTNDYVDGGISE